MAGQAGTGIVNGVGLETVHVFDLYAHVSTGVPDEVKKNPGNISIGEVFRKGLADAAAVMNYPTIYIGGVFVRTDTQSQSDDIALLMHEILHTLGFTHEQIMDKLNITGTDTGAINAALGKMCNLGSLVH